LEDALAKVDDVRVGTQTACEALVPTPL
jgi:hypothetical protein